MWLHVARRLTTLHRRNLGVKMRGANLDISLYREALPEASSAALASMLLGRFTSPTQAARRAERLLRVQEALTSLEPLDREILAPRRFEQASRSDSAEILGITTEAAANRYFRALKKLKGVLGAMPGGLEELSTSSTSSRPGSADHDRFGQIAEEFVERHRRRERPSLQGYVDRHPELADEIREHFPALVEVRRAEQDQQEATAATS